MIVAFAALLVLAGGSPEARHTADPLSVSAPPVVQRPMPERRLLLQPSLYGRASPYAINPVGVEAHLLAAYQQRLYASDSIALRDNFFLVGLKPQLNPAQGILAGVVELQPASFLNLRGAAEYWGYFGSFGAMQSFASPTVDFSGQALRDHWAAGRNYGTGGWHFVVAPTLQIAWKGFGLRLRPAFDFYSMRLRPGDSHWYNGRQDALLAWRGWTATGDVDLLYTGLSRWTIGASYALFVPLYDGADLPLRAQNAYQRVGPVVAYTFFDRGYTTFDRPTVFLLAQWYIQHRWIDTASRAIPYTVLGVSATSDFL